MKKLLILSIFLIPISVFSQSYIPVPADSTSEWRVKKMYHTKSDICLYVDDIRYYFTGDTIINSLRYFKLYKSGISYQIALGPNSNCDSTIYHFTDIYAGAVRNDTGKVFFKSIYNDPEILLYDFTLNVGDTLKRPWVSQNISTIIAIDTVIINNRQHRRFFIKADSINPGQIDSMKYITEGIGASTGLLENQNWEGSNELLCYAENHIPIYPFGCSCILNVGIKENNISKQKGSIKVFPNPASTSITIDLSDFARQKNRSIYLTNAELKELKIISIPRGSHSVTMDLSNYPAGMYFIRLQSGMEILDVEKIIKN